QSDNIDSTNADKLLIKKIVDLSSPAFIGNNSSFFEQNMITNNVIQQMGSGNTNYNPASIVAQVFSKKNDLDI
ncbi:34266_t:CDS:1, partial [Racocetra persica]